MTKVSSGDPTGERSHEMCVHVPAVLLIDFEASGVFQTVMHGDRSEVRCPAAWFPHL